MKDKVKFRLRKKNELEAYVEPYVTLNGEKVRFSIPEGIIQIKDWDKGYPKRIVKTSAIRSEMDEFRLLLEMYIDDIWKKKDRMPTKTELLRYVKDEIQGGGKKKNGLDSIFDEFIEFKLNEVKKSGRVGLSKSGLFQLRNAYSLLKEYDKRIDLDDIDEKYAGKFIKWLMIKKGFENSYVNTLNRKIKTFLHWCFEKEHTNRNLAKYFKDIQEKDKPIIALNEKEIRILEKAKPKKPEYQKYIDAFLFTSYTSMAFVDYYNFTKDWLTTIEGAIVLEGTRSKTLGEFNVPLLPEAIDILKKYNYELPKITNQKANKYLKIIFRDLGLDREVKTIEQFGADTKIITMPLYQAVGFHTARKTFVTIQLLKGVNPVLLKKMSGHVTDREFRKYISITNQDLVKEMQKAHKTKLLKAV